MPRKKIETIESVIPDEKPAADVEELPRDPLQEAIDAFGMENVRCVIYRIGRTGAPSYVSECPPASLSESFIQTMYGGGSYIVKFLDDKSRYKTSKTIHIEEPPDDGRRPAYALPNTPSPEPEPPAPPEDPAASPMLQMILHQIQSQQTMMVELIKQIGSNNRSSSLQELAGAVAMLREGMSEKTPASMVAEMVGILKTGIEIGASGGAPEKGWKEIAADVLKTIPEVIPMFTRNAPAAGAVTAGNGQVDPLVAGLRRGIAYLKPKALAGKDVGLYIELILDNREDPLYQPFLTVVNYPFEQIAREIDPEIMQPVYRQWFETLYNEVKSALTAPQIPDGGDAGGESGDTDKPAADAGSGS